MERRHKNRERRRRRNVTVIEAYVFLGAATPHKASAVASFAAACASRRLRVRDATIFGSREKIASATVKVLASDANEANGRGWSESLTARDAAERGVRVLAIDAMEDG